MFGFNLAKSQINVQISNGKSDQDILKQFEHLNDLDTIIQIIRIIDTDTIQKTVNIQESAYVQKSMFMISKKIRKKIIVNKYRRKTKYKCYFP